MCLSRVFTSAGLQRAVPPPRPLPGGCGAQRGNENTPRCYFTVRRPCGSSGAFSRRRRAPGSTRVRSDGARGERTGAKGITWPGFPRKRRDGPSFRVFVLFRPPAAPTSYDAVGISIVYCERFAPRSTAKLGNGRSIRDIIIRIRARRDP